MIRWGIFLLLIGLFSCHQDTHTSWQNLELKQTDGKIFYGRTVQQKQASVFIFFAPECPLSENYTLQTNELSREFSSDGISFHAVVTGTYYSREEIDLFIRQYDLQIPVLLDPNKELADLLRPTVTPEAFVIDKAGSIIYSGAIDNWAVDLGKKREVVTEFYLRDVLRALTQGQAIPYAKTTAVGCFIE